MFYIYVASTAFMFVFFLCSWLISPGYLKRTKSPGHLYNLLQQKDPNQLCFDCILVKPDRSRHCEICKSCVKVYDHHCPWINNCVGTKNHKFFINYIIFMWIHLAIICTLIVWNNIDYSSQIEDYLWFDTI